MFVDSYIYIYIYILLLTVFTKYSYLLLIDMCYQLTGLLYLGLQRRGHHNTSGSGSGGMQPGRMRDAKVKPLFLYSLTSTI